MFTGICYKVIGYCVSCCWPVQRERGLFTFCFNKCTIIKPSGPSQIQRKTIDEGMENTWVVCVEAKVAQDVRKILEEEKLWDESRRLQKFGDIIAIPVFNSQPELSTFHQNCPTAEIKQLCLPPSAKSKRKTHRQKLKENVQFLLNRQNKSQELLNEVPQKWERHGDLVILPSSAFTSSEWNRFGDELWTSVAEALSCNRLAQRSHILDDGFRTPKISLLLGHDGKVVHTDNGIQYSFDVTKCMFSLGNISEKLRIASWDCSQEVVVDLYAGIGYFTLPYLVHANASHVHACEWNPAAVQALRNNLVLNGVESRCTIHQGDNRQLNLSCVADRVNLGLIPSSEDGWPVAARVLKSTGGVLHIHANVDVLQKEKNKKQKVGSFPLEEACELNLCKETFQSDVLSRDCGTHKDHSDSKNCENDDSDSTCDDNNVSQEVTKKQDAGCILWAEYVCRKFEQLLESEQNGKWECEVMHVERVKSYAPHIVHVVLDLNCVPTTRKTNFLNQ